MAAFAEPHETIKVTKLDAYAEVVYFGKTAISQEKIYYFAVYKLDGKCNCINVPYNIYAIINFYTNNSTKEYVLTVGKYSRCIDKVNGASKLNTLTETKGYY